MYEVSSAAYYRRMPRPQLAATVAAVVCAVTVFAVAVGLRVAGTDALRDDRGHVAPMSADAWYYLDRTVASYRALHAEPPTPEQSVFPSWEPGLSCPTGTAPPWPHGLNLAGALLATAALGADAGPEAVRELVSWLPPLLGGLTCAVLVLLGARIFGLLAGSLAGLVLAVLPLPIWNTAWSTLDHHVFAGLVPLVVIWGMREGALHNRTASWIAAGVAMGLAHWCWTEAWFWQAALVGVGLLTSLFGLPLGDRGKGLRGIATVAVIAAVVALPGILTAPYFLADRVAPHAPGRFTLWANGAIAAAALAALVRRRAPSPAVLLTALGGAGLVALVSLIDPGMRDAYAATAGFAGRAGMVSLIDESKPLLARDFPQPLLLLSAAIVFAPALPLSWRSATRADQWWLGVWFAVSLVLALLQSRFALVFAVPFSLGIATTLVGGDWEQLYGRSRVLRVAVAVGLSTVLVSAATRSYHDPQRSLRHAFMAQIGEKIGPPPAATADTAATADSADSAENGGRRCMLAPWNLGHELLLIAKQPVVAHNFTEHEDRKAIADVDRFLFGPVAGAAAILDQRKVRLVWIEARDAADLAAHRAEIGPDAAADLRETAWLQLLLGERETAVKLGLKRSWVSPLTVEITPFGDGTAPLRVPRDQLYVLQP